MNDPGAVTGGTTPKRDIALTLAKNYLAALPSDTPLAGRSKRRTTLGEVDAERSMRMVAAR